MEMFLWRIGTGMNFRISELSDGNISVMVCLINSNSTNHLGIMAYIEEAGIDVVVGSIFS